MLSFKIWLEDIHASAYREFGNQHQWIFRDEQEKEVGEIVIKLRRDGNYEVSNILIWPQYQRKGYGTKLYKHAFEYVLSKGKKLFISNDRSPDAILLHNYFQQKGILSSSGELKF